MGTQAYAANWDRPGAERPRQPLVEPTAEHLDRPRDKVRALLAQALAIVLDNPPTAYAWISKAASLLDAAQDNPLEPYRLLEIPGTLNPWQQQLAQRLLDEGLATGCSLAAVACACDLPLRQFQRAFRRTTGESPLRWQRARRIERAKNLLYNSSLSLAQITYECGFADQAHFTRSFSASTGACPGAWRRARRAG